MKNFIFKTLTESSAVESSAFIANRVRQDNFRKLKMGLPDKTLEIRWYGTGWGKNKRKSHHIFPDWDCVHSYLICFNKNVMKRVYHASSTWSLIAEKSRLRNFISTLLHIKSFLMKTLQLINAIKLVWVHCAKLCLWKVFVIFFIDWFMIDWFIKIDKLSSRNKFNVFLKSLSVSGVNLIDSSRR